MESLGYSDLYPPQEEAVKAGVLEGQNLLLTTPTASGKTLVAMLTAGKTVLEGLGKVVYLTPLRALANEKYNDFKAFERLTKLDGKNVRVLISTGDYDSSGESLGAGDILILTNEKFDSILRHGVSWIDSVKLFVTDEIHIVGDDDRGPTLEMTVTKILSYAHEAQVLALSATVKNSKELANWLRAKLIDTRWRPIKLVEGIYQYGEISFSDGSIRKIKPTNRGHAIDVAIDTVAEGGQSLIFTETRRMAVSLALKASEVTQHHLTKDEVKEAKEVSKDIISAGEETELSRTLSKVIERGTAFHHAGLAGRHRSIVEDGFKKGLIKILTATPTLAAGVNLPARRVVISSLMRYDSNYGGKAPISVLEYKQMCGRAGRPKYDDIGETVVIAYQKDADEILYNYIKGEPEPLSSKLYDESALRFHLLATIASLPGITDAEIIDLLSKSLLATQYRRATIQSRVKRAMNYLVDEGLIERRGKRYIASEFGKRVSTLYIDPVTGVMFRRAINFADKNKPHLLGFLHLIVLSPDFAPKFPLRNRDVDEALMLIDQNRDEFLLPMPERDIYEDYLEDFRSLLVLYGWINEWSEDRLLDKLGVEPGDLHRAVENSEWLIHSLFELSKLLGRADLLLEIGELRQRIEQGIKSELITLAKLEGIGRVRARSLYNHGLIDLEKLASASEDKIASVPKIGTIIAKSIKKQLSRLGEK
ncbi:MAG: DEAD/DEAH box helicase [archaeon]|nr:DEAD/DEAH box helicase [archaeon]